MEEMLWQACLLIWLASAVAAALLCQCGKKKAKAPPAPPTGAGSKNASKGSTSSNVKPMEGGSKMAAPATKKAVAEPEEKSKLKKSVAKPLETDFNSQKKKLIEAKLEKERQEKIEKGFFQSRSDEDDTLEKVDSCKSEKTDEGNSSKKKSSKKGKSREKRKKV